MGAKLKAEESGKSLPLNILTGNQLPAVPLFSSQLLDTHVYVWWLEGSFNLSPATTTTIVTADQVFVSSASIWEAATKSSIGKLAVDIDQLIAEIDSNGFQELPVNMRHITALSRLPALHQDPFDRMLVAQAISEPLRLVTADQILASYTDLVDLI